MKIGLVLSTLVLLLGAGDLPALLEKIGKEPDSTRRRALVEGLAERHTHRAASALDKIVRGDSDVTVRVVAARGLARSKAGNATELLAGLVVHGGVRGVRGAVARGLAAREGGAALLTRLFEKPGQGALTKGLVIEAQAAVPGPAALYRLLALAAGADVFLRCEALRAMAARTDGADELVAVLAAILRKHRDVATVMTVLDLVEARPDVRHLPAVEPLETFLEPTVRDAAGHAIAVLRHAKASAAAKAAAAAAKEEGYEFAPPQVPEPPPPRPRFDLVYGFDSTGSVCVHLDKIRDRIGTQFRFLAGLGSDVRVGIVVFRDQKTMGKYPLLQVQPLTHDLKVVAEFLDGIRAGGADLQGAAVSVGLHEGLDRMGWRRTARRTFTLIADSRLDDPLRCRRTAGIHRSADGTRIKLIYMLRTRRTIPDCVKRLAEIGGSTLEILE